MNSPNYYPYGKILRKYTNGPEEKFLTTQHERDQETGLDYRGARFYDADVARFLSLDPFAANYPSLSDYSYVAGNPLMFVDPTGMAVEDHYTIDAQGYIKKVKETDDNYDMLFLESDYNKDGGQEKGLKVINQTLLSKLSAVENRGSFKLSYVSSSNMNELFDLFYFVANNTKVEWHISGYRMTDGNKYVMTTIHEKSKSSPAFKMDEYHVFNMIFTMHSHPGKVPEWGVGASGKGLPNEDGIVNTYNQDMAALRSLYRDFTSWGMKDPKKWFEYNGSSTIFPKHYVYQVGNKTLYNYNITENDIYIRKTKNANDLYRNLGF